MKISEIAFTCYPVTDLKRARKFYEGTLGLTASRVFGDDEKAWIEYDIGPGTLSIGNMEPEWKASAGGGAVGLEVDNFEAAIQELKAAGYQFVAEPFESPVCHMAVVSDPDGNSVCVHNRKG